MGRPLAALSLPLLLTCAAAQDARPLSVPPVLMEAPYDGFTIGDLPEQVAALREHEVTVAGQPATGARISLWGARCEWTMPTPEAGAYLVSLNMSSGDQRPGRFEYRAGDQTLTSDEFREPGSFVGCLRVFRILVPAGQPRTRMALSGQGLYFARAEIARVKTPVEGRDGRLTELAEASYRTVLKRPGAAPAAVVLLPPDPAERQLAAALAARLGVPTRPEPELTRPFPAFPVPDLPADTNLVVLCGYPGGPLTQAMRRAGWIDTDLANPGPGGAVLRTIARPFDGQANVLALSGSDAAGLARAAALLQPTAAGGELLWDRFLIDEPGERWAQLRGYRYRLAADDPWWQTQRDRLARPGGGFRGSAPARTYITLTAEWGDWYWRTGQPAFAELLRDYLFKMQDEDIYGGGQGADSHMALFLLLRAWDRAEEAPVLSPADRLRITNYLLLRCVEGNEGFARSFSGYETYSGPVRMRHNHQTILGCGLMQAALYYGRLYQLGRAAQWRAWCDDLIANGTLWGHAPEDSPNYEPRTFLEVAGMLHYQGLTTQGHPGTVAWLDAARRFLAARDSFSLPACYGDCWDEAESASFEFFDLLREDWDWAPAQVALDRLITGYRAIHPKSSPASELSAWQYGSTAVGGLRPPPDAAAAKPVLDGLLGLAALPMTPGYYDYMTGRVGNRAFWDKVGRPTAPPYERTADKVQYRSGWGPDDEYLLLETLGWADHGHLDLGTIVQYCAGGRVWVVDSGYENTAARHHSTLEVSRDGRPAWSHLGDEKGRWGDFRAGPQMLELTELTPAAPGRPGPFTIAGRAHDLAGATWTRTVTGGAGPLTLADELVAEQPGRYEVVWRLRLLGEVTGSDGRWQAVQRGAVLPVTLTLLPGDQVAIGPWEPDSHTVNQGRYPWYPFIADDGRPKTIEWRRTVRLGAGAATAFRAVLGPARATSP